MRLIDADELKEQFCEENEDIPNGYNDDLDDYFGSGFSAGRVSTLIDSAQTVDAVPVVRCKDCKFHDEDDCSLFCDGYWCECCNRYTTSDGFCSYAVKKEEQR